MKMVTLVAISTTLRDYHRLLVRSQFFNLWNYTKHSLLPTSHPNSFFEIIFLS
ncbi:MAG: hypothetical protein V7K36_31365 [Nostoc sp.]